MRAFQQISLKRRLRKIITMTSAIALTLACVAICGYQFVAERYKAVHELTVLARIVEANSAAALTTQNAKAAGEVLQALRTNPEVLSARIYRSDGTLFAQYVRAGADVLPPSREHQQDGHWFEGWQLIVGRRIQLGGQSFGTVVLRGDLRDQYSRLRDYVTIVAILMLASTCAAFLLSNKLQNTISAPILELARVAQGVTEKKDYSLRAHGKRMDEVGLLIDAFNQMLDRIQERETEVTRASAELEKRSGELEVELGERQRAEERFRQLAETISEVFWMTNIEKSQMIYVSPAYEQIWGRTCESLYKAPMNWMEAIHPGDRERVRRAALSKQVHGTYDEEYRIVRPSGAIRWVRDRAFPILDKQGKPYRIAGIAEDITERKLAEEDLRLQGEIARNMDEGVLLVRAADSTIIYANPKFEHMFGYEAGELKGRSTSVLTAVDQVRADEIGNAIVESLYKSGHWSGELHNRRKDGTEFWTCATISDFHHRDYGRVRISVETDITEQKRAAETIERLAAIVRFTEDAVLSASRDGLINSWNAGAERIYGYSAAEAIGQSIAILAPADRKHEPADTLKRVLSGEHIRGFETFRRRKDGTLFPVSLTLSPIRSHDGRIVGASSIARDITARKQAEQALRAQQQEQQAILNSVPALIWYKDCHNRIIRLNQSAAASIGKAVEEMEGRRVEEFYPDEAAKYYQDDLEVINSGQPKLGIVEELLTASGEKCWIQTDKAPFYNEHSEIIGLIVCAVDITQRKHAESRLRQAEEKYRLLVERVPAITYIAELGRSGRWHYVSPQIEPLLGFSPAEWMANSDLWYERIHPDDRGRAVAEDEDSLKSGRYENEYRLIARDGRVVWCRDEGVLIGGEDLKSPLLHGVMYDITERKRAEEAMRDTEQRLQAIIDNSAAVIYVKDRNGKYLLINRQYETLFQVTRSGIIEKTDYDIFPREHAAEFRKHDLRVLKEKVPIHFDEAAPHADGLHDYVSVKFPLFDPAGEPYAVCGISTDITERKRAEETRRRLAAIVEFTEDAIISGALDGTVHSWNNAAEKMYGYTAAEMVGRSLFDIVPPEYREEVSGILQKLHKGEVVTNYETVKLAKGGRRVNVSTTISPIRNEHGEVTGLSVITRDITERKKAEQALQTQARVLENMVEGVLVYDDHERILFTNHALEAMFGYGKGELIGQLTFVLNPYPPEICSQVAGEVRDDLRTRKSVQREFLNRRKDGSEFVSESRISKFQIDGQWCNVAVVQDVTRRKRMEKELLEISDREQRRIGQDLHDGLSQLLTGTAFASKVLEERLAAKSSPETGQAAKVVELLESATSEARRVARGLHPVQLEAGGLPSALQELADSVQTLFGVSCRFAGSDSVRVRDTATATHVYRIAQEAVNNAVRHSGARQIVIGLTQRRGTTTLTVDDDGKGLPKGPRRGLGMGMSIMAYRAQMIGGTIQFERRPKGGTRVVCSFKIE